MAKPSEKLQAIALREAGESIKEIARKVGVSRGSVSKWVRDIMLTEDQRITLEQQMFLGKHRGRIKGAETNHRKKSEAIKEAEKSDRMNF